MTKAQNLDVTVNRTRQNVNDLLKMAFLVTVNEAPINVTRCHLTVTYR